MAGNSNFELSSVSPDDSGFSGNYSNDQRSNYASPSLDRSGSFREGSEGRSFSSGPSTSKISTSSMIDLAPLSQCLVLEPIAMGDLKNIRAGELRRALGFGYVNISDDNTFGAAHSKPPTTLAFEEIKRFKSGVHEGMLKARNRMKRVDDSLNKLNKYLEGLNSKKQLPNERSSGSSLLKMGNQSHRSSPENVIQRLEDRNKLNKRARTPLGDMRAEGRSNGVPRQHLVSGKDKDGAKESSSDLGDEKTRRLPAGGEGWDRKMKRRRSVSSVFPRPVDGDGELKRTVHGRLGNDSGIHPSDAHGFRSGSINGAIGSNKIERAPSPVGLSARMTPKNELDKTSLSREPIGMNKERLLQKGNSKLSVRDDPSVFCPGSVTKGKASRAPRTGPPGNSSPSFSRMSGTTEDWELNKVHSLAGINRKRALPSDSSSPPMAQWVGQRPQKISRNRRTNIISPTSNHDEVQIASEGCNPDCSARFSSAANGSVPMRNIMSSSQQLKTKLDNAPSPARLSESEENSVPDNRLKDKELGGSELDEKSSNSHQHLSPGLFTKKSKLLVNDGMGDGIRRQGRSGRGSSMPKGRVSPAREKLENPAMIKSVQTARPGSEKNGSRSGRPPLKKHSDRKGFTRLGPVANSSSPDFTGESDDDHEELLSAAQFACNASYNGCCSSFWKRMERIFYYRPEDKSFLEEQLKAVEDLSNKEMQSVGDNMDHVSQGEYTRTQDIVSEENKTCILSNGLTNPSRTGDLISCFKDTDSSYGGLHSDEEPNSLMPLYQRVLSALLVEDELEEFEENRSISHDASVASRNDLCTYDEVFCNGNASHSRFSNSQLPTHEDIEEDNNGFKHLAGQAGVRPYENDTNRSLVSHTNSAICSSYECEYNQMCTNDKLLHELQSIGLYPETVPDLAEGEDELINQEIIQLKKQLSQQAGKKKAHLDKLRIAIEDKKDVKERDLEQIAMNRLIELAYRKLLATRGSSAARIGITKVSKHVALAFIRRTLSRCRKFEVTGKSCFSEPALRDVLLAVPCNNIGAVSGPQSEHNLRLNSSSGPHITDPELNDQNNRFLGGPFDAYEAISYQSDHAFAKNGPILNRGKKKEVLLDDVGGNPALRSTAVLGAPLTGGAKGKRSERDSGPKLGRPKTKTKPKQKATQSSTHPVQPSVRKREGLISPGNILDSSKESKDVMDLSGLPLSELDSIEDLNVANELEGHQDLSSWLNFDEDGLQDHDSMGLEIPMDDLSELHMLL